MTDLVPFVSSKHACTLLYSRRDRDKSLGTQKNVTLIGFKVLRLRRCEDQAERIRLELYRHFDGLEVKDGPPEWLLRVLGWHVMRSLEGACQSNLVFQV